MTKYQDFWIRLVDVDRPDTYRVDVVTSPRVGGKSSFQLPFHTDDLGETLTSLGEAIRGQSRDAAKPIYPEEIGRKLYDALFVDGTRDRFLESYGSIGENGLRIKRSKQSRSGNNIVGNWEAYGHTHNHNKVVDLMFQDPEIEEFHY